MKNSSKLRDIERELRVFSRKLDKKNFVVQQLWVVSGEKSDFCYKCFDYEDDAIAYVEQMKSNS